eukprot:1154255-Pelagomonas_calceolata.AAC.8
MKGVCPCVNQSNVLAHTKGIARTHMQGRGALLGLEVHGSILILMREMRFLTLPGVSEKDLAVQNKLETGFASTRPESWFGKRIFFRHSLSIQSSSNAGGIVLEKGWAFNVSLFSLVLCQPSYYLRCLHPAQDFSTIGSWLPEEIDPDSPNCLLAAACIRHAAFSMQWSNIRNVLKGSSTWCQH